MKHLLLIFGFIFATIIVSGQTSVVELHYGDVLVENDIEIEFLKVISDSRCPKNVQCIRAGEAKVLVAIYKNGQLSEEKVLVFFASGVTNETHNIFMSTSNLRLKGLRLHPYPSGLGSIPDKDYYLQIQIN